MQKVTTKLENCYGINSLNHTFNFAKKNANLIYAPNGMMKSSFARAFKDHSQDKDSEDRIYKDRIASRNICDENSINIPAETIFVIEPYDSSYESDRVSTLLANKELKAEYDVILKGIDEKSEALMVQLRKISGVRTGLEDIISHTFTKEPDNLLRAFDRIKSEVLDDPEDPELEGIKYNQIFSKEVEELIADEATKQALEEYTANYDTLLSKSRYFRKGVFNHYQAGEIAKQLKNHGFFKADHKISLNSGKDETRVESEVELEKLIGEELETILSDETLKASFDKIDDQLSNKKLRDFREFLLANKTLIPRLNNLDLFREALLKSYMQHHRESFNYLIEEYTLGKKRLDEIANEATNEATKWQDVINIFNRRFSVPFEVLIENKKDVILKRVTPNIGFTFMDQSEESTTVEHKMLLDVLSNGERRALYILNIIFEVQARIEERLPTLFIVDDIADSFDYKNKYAIVEYLSDMLSEENFRQIIMTHNYDFYRTVWKRLELSGANYHVSKTSKEVLLTEERMYRDPFQKWKANAGSGNNTDCLLAMIPFVRNLAEYCGYDDEFNSLTTALHLKIGKPPLIIGDMLKIFSDLLNGQDFESNIENAEHVIPLILAEAKKICEADDPTMDLEKKVVLSIAIRLKAEQFMIDKIDDNDWVKTIQNNQTSALSIRFKEIAKDNAEFAPYTSIIDRVNLMTPENIHLNSFMYEPILDMSLEHLKSLFLELEEL